MNGAMKQARLLAANLNRRVGPIADSLEDSLSIAAEDSPVRFELNQALRELTAAARSIRGLAEQLERNPDALLRGKRSPGGY
jgi:paraquat-inducible protein B